MTTARQLASLVMNETAAVPPAPGPMSQNRHLSPRRVAERLRAAGFKPTRPRLLIGLMLFGKGDRHVSADQLHREASMARYPISLATVYNTLNSFAARGLLRPIELAGGRMLFDTDTSPHHHFVIEGEDDVLDVPEGALCFARMPEAPPGMRIVDVQVIVRVAPIDSEEAGA
jgi:Fur family iron response transcriptional regulator